MNKIKLKNNQFNKFKKFRNQKFKIKQKIKSLK